MSRTASISRKTAETGIELDLDLDGCGNAHVDTGVGFLNHMLTLFAAHSLFDLRVAAKGDLDVDQHHTVEDVGICLGKALGQALGDKSGIARYGSTTLPMDETLVTSALDLSGRMFFVFDVTFATEKIGVFDAELVRADESASRAASRSEQPPRGRGHLQGDGAGAKAGGRLRSAPARRAVVEGNALDLRGGDACFSARDLRPARPRSISISPWLTHARDFLV